MKRRVTASQTILSMLPEADTRKKPGKADPAQHRHPAAGRSAFASKQIITPDSWPVHRSKPLDRSLWLNQRLFAAAGEGKVDGVRDAISMGAAVNARNQWKDTPLMHAAFHGSVAPVKFLLAKGADPRAVNSNGRSALDMALGAKKWKVARALKDHMAKDNSTKTTE